MRRVLLILLAFALVAAGGFAVYAWEPPIAPVEAQAAASFAPGEIKKGGELAAVGNCNICHTAPGGEPFAGGLDLPTPFGTIRSTNITPDVETGIGAWSLAAFTRAMRRGVDREGAHLYPAFPYDHFTHVTDEDDKALYAFLMTRKPVKQATPANKLVFPLNLRFLVAGWNLLFLHEGPLGSESGRDAAWNHGRYLVEGLGHCGACHTPRNVLGAEKSSQEFAGAPIEGWFAYPINAASPAPVPWNAATLAAYLRTGFHVQHGVSRGPMSPVTANLGAAGGEEAAAIAAYIADRMGPPSQERTAYGETMMAASRPRPSPDQAGDAQVAPPSAEGGAEDGGAIFAATCASCHDGSRAPPHGGLNFHLSTAVNARDPQNIIDVMLFGLPAAPGEASAIMPGFRGVLDADQATALVDYLRRTFSDKPAWSSVRSKVEATMAGRTGTRLYASDGVQATPADPTMRTSPWP